LSAHVSRSAQSLLGDWHWYRKVDTGYRSSHWDVWAELKPTNTFPPLSPGNCFLAAGLLISCNE